MTKNQRSDAQERAIPTTGMPLVIYVLMVGAFLAGTSEFVMAGLLPLIAADYGVSVAEMGLAITAFATGIVIGAPSMALLSARLPRRAILVMAMLGFAAGHVLAALAPSFGLLLAARFLTALATGAYWGVASLTAAAAAGRFASRALGLVLGGSMAAIVVGVPLGAFAGQSVGWRIPFWVIAGLGVGAAGMLARLVPSQPGGHATSSIRAQFAALRRGRLWLTLATCMLVTACVITVYSYIALVLTQRTGLPEEVVPLVLMSFGASAFIGNQIGGRHGDRHPYRTLYTTVTLTAVAVIGLLLFSTHVVPTLALFALLGLVGLSSNPVLVSLAVRFGGDAPALAASLPTSVFNVGTAVGTAIAAAAVSSPLGTLAPLVVATVAALLIFLPLTALARNDHPARRAAAT